MIRLLMALLPMVVMAQEPICSNVTLHKQTECGINHLLSKGLCARFEAERDLCFDYRLKFPRRGPPVETFVFFAATRHRLQYDIAVLFK